MNTFMYLTSILIIDTPVRAQLLKCICFNRIKYMFIQDQSIKKIFLTIVKEVVNNKKESFVFYKRYDRQNIFLTKNAPDPHR